MGNKFKNMLGIGALALAALFSSAQAQAPGEKGLTIAAEADRRSNGFVDYTVSATLTLTDGRGQTTKRELSIKTLEISGDGDKQLIVFNSPRDVQGTAFLSFTHALQSDDQWIFLPALKRVKRIASSNKSGPFMGSEFTYEDLGSREPANYSFKYLKNENLDGIDHFVVEAYPRYQHSGYTRQTLWYNSGDYSVSKIVFYDRKNALLKTATYGGYQLKNTVWLPGLIKVTNHQNGKASELSLSNYSVGVGLSERSFSKNALKRAR